MGYTDTAVNWRGRKFNQRTIDMILEAELLYGSRVPISQGSFNSSVSQSAGTHDGGGAVDFAYTNDKWVRILRMVGFAAWHRTPAQGNWGHHTHAIALDDPAASRGAKNQMTSYRNGRNGLANNGSDNHWRPSPIRNWEQYKDANKLPDTGAPDEEGDLLAVSNADARKIALAVLGYINDGSKTDVYGKIVGTHAQVGYLEEQLVSIVDGNKALVSALGSQGDLSSAQVADIRNRYNGIAPGRVIKKIPNLPNY